MRPRVICNFAPSIDGKIAQARKRAPFTMSRYPEDPKRMRELRARVDAVLVGATNLHADDPDLMPSRLRVVVTHDGEQLEPTARAFNPKLGGETVVAHGATMPQAKREALGAVATLVELGSSEVDLPRLLEWLVLRRGCREIVCEGGGVLVAGLFAARAVDELSLTLVPRILGGSSAPTVVEGAGFEPDVIPDAQLVRVERLGDELFLLYAFDWDGEPTRQSAIPR
jgi:5-amino-6-(5-phosphoribosylamino)uracil reductase